jgi:hydrogenase nickel incorporation protein HypA/HybF
VHERAVVADLIRKATEVAEEQGSSQVIRMTVRVGALSHVDPAVLPSQMAQVAVGTMAAGAAIEVVRFDGDPLDDPHGSDVILESVEVATSADPRASRDGQRDAGDG